MVEHTTAAVEYQGYLPPHPRDDDRYRCPTDRVHGEQFAMVCAQEDRGPQRKGDFTSITRSF